MHRLLLISVFTVTSALIDSAALAQQFDGRWRVVATPEMGSCHRTHRYTILVENGVARNASRQAGGKVTGGLEQSGRVRVSVQRPRGRPDITGELKGW
ncbi:hypothetical protein KBI52_22175 [Microvirga sp. HBU67558]|uniref:hypothetical protein n=1 Tax=Microvirga TaxID=186650 RepID=UPI001B35FB0E|nr:MULTISPECIES: hypothetical protein [unclassified Microvirga]MBQ0822899.1 hypothetical protein [Microvirga sp. HBU67558]